MIDQAKIVDVKQYLQAEFPGAQVDDADDFEAASWRFRALKDSTVYLIKFESLFWRLCKDVYKALEDSKLSKVMKDNEGKQVMVTKEGRLVVF